MMGEHRPRLLAVALRLLSALVAVHKQLVFHFDLESDTIRDTAHAPHIEFRNICPDAFSALSRWPGARSVVKFRRFLNQGQVGLYTLKDNEPVFCHWCKVKRKPFAFSCSHDPIEVGTAYLHRGETRKDLRKTGLGTLSVGHLIKALRERPEVRNIEVAVEPGNIASQKLFLKLGFTKVRQFTLLVLLALLHIHILRELQEDGTPGPASYRFSLKVPMLFWSPVLFSINSYREIMNRLA